MPQLRVESASLGVHGVHHRLPGSNLECWEGKGQMRASRRQRVMVMVTAATMTTMAVGGGDDDVYYDDAGDDCDGQLASESQEPGMFAGLDECIKNLPAG